MNFVFFVVAFATFSTSVYGQYDDISILGEVLERSTSDPAVEGSGVEESSTTTFSTTTKEETTTEVNETPSTTTEATTSAAETTETTTTVAESKTTTEEAITETVTIVETTPEEMEVESFLGFKKPDLATIYRRLFPFQHPGQVQHRQYQYQHARGGF